MTDETPTVPMANTERELLEACEDMKLLLAAWEPATPDAEGREPRAENRK